MNRIFFSDPSGFVDLSQKVYVEILDPHNRVGGGVGVLEDGHFDTLLEALNWLAAHCDEQDAVSILDAHGELLATTEY